MDDSPDDLPSEIEVSALSRALVEAAQVARIGLAVTLIQIPTPRCVYMNDAALEMLGRPRREFLEGDPLRHIAPEHMPGARERLQRRIEGETGHASYELNVFRGDGTRAYIEVTTSFARVGGRPALFAFLVDVTKRREAEQAWRRTESSFRLLLESAPEAFGILENGCFVYANPAYLKLLGYESLEDIQGIPIVEMVQEGARLGACIAYILEGERPQAIECHVRRPDGSVLLVEVSGAPAEWKGRTAILSMVRDIGARKALEAQLIQADRLAAIGTMAAGVAHEINNPLAYVMLNLEWTVRKLAESARDPVTIDLVELLREAHRGTERVATIVRDLRAFSRADAETRHRVELADVVRSAIKMAGHEIRHRARIATSFHPAGAVWSNESRLEQVVLNLLINAAHAMPESRTSSNEIRVTVRAEGDGAVLLEVADNGEGIPPEVLPRIFDPFFTTKPRGVGMGLGLSTCHGIVVSLGGSISVYSTSSEGTVFRVVLPTTDRADVDIGPPASDTSSREPSVRARILVVDDEMPIANAMRELLGTQHEVTTATTVRDALAAMAAKRDFDVIFWDLMMPGMSGMDVFEELRESQPDVARRIVFMTGGAFTARAATFFATLGTRRLEKPFSLALVEQIVREMAAERTPVGVEPHRPR